MNKRSAEIDPAIGEACLEKARRVEKNRFDLVQIDSDLRSLIPNEHHISTSIGVLGPVLGGQRVERVAGRMLGTWRHLIDAERQRALALEHVDSIVVELDAEYFPNSHFVLALGLLQDLDLALDVAYCRVAVGVLEHLARELERRSTVLVSRRPLRCRLIVIGLRRRLLMMMSDAAHRRQMRCRVRSLHSI